MAVLSDYSEIEIGKWLLGKATPATAGTRYLALFTSAPTDAGNGIEVAGGAYARQDATTAFPTPTSNATSSNAAINFPQASSNWGSVSHWGVMDSNVIKSFTNAEVNTGTDGITITSHGIATGTQARVSKATGATMPTGLTEGTAYYVRSVDANTISLHPTAADATGNTNKVDITAAGSGSFYLGCGNILFFGALRNDADSADEPETINSSSSLTFPSTKLTLNTDNS